MVADGTWRCKFTQVKRRDAEGHKDFYMVFSAPPGPLR